MVTPHGIDNQIQEYCLPFLNTAHVIFHVWANEAPDKVTSPLNKVEVSITFTNSIFIAYFTVISKFPFYLKCLHLRLCLRFSRRRSKYPISSLKLLN